jgi:hypothetical protein
VQKMIQFLYDLMLMMSVVLFGDYDNYQVRTTSITYTRVSSNNSEKDTSVQQLHCTRIRIRIMIIIDEKQ